MTAVRFFPSGRPSDELTDRALRDLLGPTAPPALRRGFDRRLTRAIEADRERRRAPRGLRRIMWAYWTVTILASSAILWRAGNPLMTGSGLWIGIGGAASLAFAVLCFSILAPLPMKLLRGALDR